MKTILIALAFMATVGVASAELPPPTHANVVYGSHPRNVLDLWLAPSDKPTPLLVNIHGGGFRSGDKSKFSASLIEMMASHPQVCQDCKRGDAEQRRIAESFFSQRGMQ